MATGLSWIAFILFCNIFNQIIPLTSGQTLNNCHPPPHFHSSVYIIGYGSLLNTRIKYKSYPGTGINIPVIVSGYSRNWNTKGYSRQKTKTFLGVDEGPSAPNSFFNGVAFQLQDVQSLLKLDKKHSSYCRKLVSGRDIRFLIGPGWNATVGREWPRQDAQFWIYVARPEFVAWASDEYPIVQSYVEVFWEGCIEMEETYKLQGYADLCLTHTRGLEYAWINDKDLTKPIDITLAIKIKKLFNKTFPNHVFPEVPYKPLSHNPDDIKFFLFPPHIDPKNRQEIQLGDNLSLMRSSFLPNTAAILVIHGLEKVPDYVFSKNIQKLINAYVSSGIKANFIGVNWKKLNSFDWDYTSRPDLLPGFYIGVIQNSHIVAERVVQFICWLVEQNVLKFNQVHLIGFSMGTIVSALVGRRVQHVTGGERIGRITGLDPAVGLLDPPNVPDAGPSSGDAFFVDVFHTNGGMQGNSLVKQADMNIIVNNGVFQPGCGKKSIAAQNVCSHNFAVVVYTATIRKTMIACECPPWRRVEGTCEHPCASPTIVGPFCPENARGSFFLRTSSKP